MTESDALSFREINEELNKISTLNAWGFVGIIFPVAGFICGGIAFSRGKKLQLLMSNEDKLMKIVRNRMTMSLLVLLLSTVAAGVMAINIIESNNRRISEQAAAREAEEQQKLQAEQAAASAESTRAEQLSTCLDNAYKNYTSAWNTSAAVYGSDGKLPNDQAMLLDSRHQSAKDDCYKLNN